MIPRKSLTRKFSLKTEKLSREEKQEVLIVYDYILHTEVHKEADNKGLSGYAFRRYDSFVLLSSTTFCLWVGLVSGLLARLLCMLYFPTIPALSYDSRELIIWGPLIATISLFSLIMFEGQRWLENEYSRMHEVIIENSKIRLEDLKNAFHQWPNIFDKVSQSQETTEIKAGNLKKRIRKQRPLDR